MKRNSHGLSLFGTNSDLEILILNPAVLAKSSQGGMLSSLFGGGQQQQNRSVKGTMIDGLCDAAYTKKRKAQVRVLQLLTTRNSY